MKKSKMKFLSLLVALSMLFNFISMSYAYAQNTSELMTQTYSEQQNDTKKAQDTQSTKGDATIVKPQLLWAVWAIIVGVTALAVSIYQTYKSSTYPDAHNFLVTHFKTDGNIYEEYTFSKECIEVKLSGHIFDHRLATNYVGLGLTNNGTRVWDVEDYLKRQGSFTGTPNSTFDAATTTAIKKFQKLFGLTEDGKCGRTTYEKMTKFK